MPLALLGQYAFKALLSPWTYIALLALFAGLQTHRLHAAQNDANDLTQRLKVQVEAVQVAVGVNANEQTVIDGLQKRIQNMVDERAIEAQAWSAELAARDLKAKAALADAATQRKERETLWNETQTCKGAATMRLDTMCPSLSQRLRDRTQGTGTQ